MEEYELALQRRARRKAMGRAFSRIGWGLTAMTVLTSALQIAGQLFAMRISPEFAQSELLFWLLSTAPLYLAGIPAFWLITRDMPESRPTRRVKVGPGAMACLLMAAMGMNCYGGLYTLGLNGLLGKLKGSPLADPSAMSLSDTNLAVTLLVACLLGPFMEELLFRGLLMRRLRPYGGWLAILGSSVTFMLLHGNTFQSLNVLGAGLVLSLVAELTGSFKASAVLHMLMNLTVLLLQRAVLGGQPVLVAVGGLLLLSLVIAGIVLTALGVYRLCRMCHPLGGARLLGRFFLSPGVLVYTLLQLALIVRVVLL